MTKLFRIFLLVFQRSCKVFITGLELFFFLFRNVICFRSTDAQFLYGTNKFLPMKSITLQWGKCKFFHFAFNVTRVLANAVRQRPCLLNYVGGCVNIADCELLLVSSWRHCSNGEPESRMRLRYRPAQSLQIVNDVIFLPRRNTVEITIITKTN